MGATNTLSLTQAETGRDLIAGSVSGPADMVAIGSDITQHKNVFIQPQPVDEVTVRIALVKLATLPLNQVPTIASLPRSSRLLYRFNARFVGREAELRRLAAILKGDGTEDGGQIVVISGLGGIGKTQLATAFVQHYGQFFAAGVFWLSMANPEAVSAQVADCGMHMLAELGLGFPSLDLETQVRLVWTAWQSELPRLLVFDNCEDAAVLKQWWPRTGSCKVLVTSRRSRWDLGLDIATLVLGILPRPHSIGLLRKFRPNLPEDDPVLDQIASELGDLPLALHMAGSYLAHYHDIVSPIDYLNQLQRQTVLQHRSMQSGDGSPTEHEQHVFNTFELSYKRLDASEAADALALRLLACAACFSPGEPIPRSLLRDSAGFESDDADVAIQIEDALQRLASLGLLNIEVGGIPRLHRLLMHFVQEVNGDNAAQANVEEAVLQTANRLNNVGYPTPLLAWQVHLRYVTDTAKGRFDTRAAALCTTFGFHLHMVGDYAAARLYFEQALAIYTFVQGEQHPDTARSLNNLGSLLKSMGDYLAARPYFGRALAITSAIQGEQHPDTATSLNNLGSLLHAMGDYPATRPYFEQALAIRRHILGEWHPDTATSLNNLGYLLHAMGNYPAALPYFEQALAINIAILGDQHPNTAMSLNSLGYLLESMGDYPAALPYYKQALAIYRAVLGEQHPHTATSLNNLGSLLEMMGDYLAARPYFEQALAITSAILGEQHPDTARSLNNVGLLLHAMGEYEAARPYYEKALAINIAILGDQHPDTARSLNNMGLLLHAMGNYLAARPYFEQGLAIHTAVLSDQHPDTARSLNNLGMLLHAMGEYTAARPYFEQALAIYTVVLSDQHPDTERARKNLAYLHTLLKDSTYS